MAAVPRILMHVHSYGSFGHMSRIVLLAQQLREQENADVIVLSGGERGCLRLVPPSVEVVQIPALSPASGLYAGLVSPSLGCPVTGIISLRRHILEAVLGAFRPDIYLTEFFPFGRMQMLSEFRRGVEFVRKRLPGTKIVCLARDIVCNERDKGRISNPEARLISSFIRNFYDLVLVPSDRKLHDFLADYDFLSRWKEKFVYTGIIVRRGQLKPAARKNSIIINLSSGKGAESILAVCSAFCRSVNSSGIRYKGLLVSGVHQPLLPDARCPGFECRDYVQGLSGQFPLYERIITTAGYNSAYEALVSRRPVVLIPLKASTEQKKRAALLAGRGLAKIVPEARLTVRLLKQAVRTAPTTDGFPFDCNGAACAARHLTKLAGVTGRRGYL